MSDVIHKTKLGDWIELLFTGYHNGMVFDSNIPEDLKQLSKEAKAQETILKIGESMVVPGLDKALEDKELGKEYTISVLYKNGFGPRQPELIKTIPLKVFTEQKINPQPGQTLLLDKMLVRIITVSGGRVITDFNTPLAGKDISYKFIIKGFITDLKKKSEAYFGHFVRVKPAIEIKDNKAIIKGPEQMKSLVEVYKPKFKEIVGSELEFELEEKKTEKKEEEKVEKTEETNTLR